MSSRRVRGQPLHPIYALVRKHPEISRAACSWAILGHLVVHAAGGIVTRDRGLLVRAWGNVVGLTQALRGQLDQIWVNLK